MGSDPLFRDGVIVIDKPVGPTSHDIVAVMRRATRRRAPFPHRVDDPRRPQDAPSGPAGGQADTDRGPSIADPGPWTVDRRSSTVKVGHTGTLDPLASGVLPLVLGKATRLAQFLSGADKAYEADIELGVSTTTLDRAGAVVERVRPRTIDEVTPAEIEAAVAEFRGTYLQQPPAYSAKKIGGDRAYDLARKNAAVPLKPAPVTVTALEVLDWHAPRLRLHLVCSAGFYVRALADALGERLGTGAHLAALVRTRSGEFTLDHAVGLDVLDQRPAEAAQRVIPLAALLPTLPALTLTPEGASLAARGGLIGPPHVMGAQRIPLAERVRLLHPDGHLVAIAEPSAGGRGRSGGLLHPGVVLE